MRKLRPLERKSCQDLPRFPNRPWPKQKVQVALPPGPAPSCDDVVDVLDGSTIKLDCGYDEAKPRIYAVRLHCTKAPALDQQPWGRHARDHLENIAAHAVAIEPVTFSGTQLVARVHDLDGELNLQMITDGFATVDSGNCNDQRYDDAKRRAKEEKKGFWAGEGVLEMTVNQ